MAVGIKADKNSSTGETPPLKYGPNTAMPAGFGAFAITVNPPPAIAPDMTKYFMESEKFGTSEAKYVMAALSLNAVSTIEHAKSSPSENFSSSGSIHHA